MNDTAVLHSLMNAAFNSANAAQAALDAVGDLGTVVARHNASQTAVNAENLADSGLRIWDNVAEQMRETQILTDYVLKGIKVRKQIAKQAARHYDKAIMRARAFAPMFPNDAALR
jgi:hypothetical protein